MFDIRFSEDALLDLDALKKSQRVAAVKAAESQLQQDPLTASRHRKQLRENPISSWEMRVGDLRVFYDVDVPNKVVLVKAVGVKEHNRLFIRGKEFEL